MLKNKLSRLFLKTFGITFLTAAAIFAAGWFTLRHTLGPSDVTPPSETAPVVDETPAFILPEHENAVTDAGLPDPEPPDTDERKRLFFTFLIIGLDEGVNTDTIMTAAYDGAAKQAYVIGIPRDSKVNVERRTKKINAAYPVGTLNGGGREGGINQLKREINTIVGFVPDYYVIVDFKAFTRIIDAVNGVEVDVPFDMVYDDPEQNLHINIPKGRQTLNGADALKFARYRIGNDRSKTITDYQRIENQQAVIQAVIKKLLTPASILNIPEYISIFNDHVHTDIKLYEMVFFAEQLAEVRNNENALEAYTLPTTGTSGPPGWYELLDGEAIIELVNRTVNPYLRDIGPEDLDIIE